jgi:hypothetical protein
MRETAVPAPEILYMNEYAIYNLIWIEIRLKLKLNRGGRCAARRSGQSGDLTISPGWLEVMVVLSP